MKKWFPVAIALVIGLVPSTAPGGSLAARVQAAKAAREAAKQATEAATVTVPQVTKSTATLNAPPSGRINVADWLNGATDANPQTEPEVVPKKTVATPQLTTSRRRTVSTPHSAPDPAPTPPTHSSNSAILDLANPLAEISAAASPETPNDPPANSMTLDLVNQEGQIDSEPTHVPSAQDDEPAVDEKQVADTLGQQTTLGQPPPLGQQTVKGESATDKAEQEEEAEAKVSYPETKPLQVIPVKPKKQFSRGMLQLRDRNRSCLMYYYQRPESSTARSPWGVMHALISFGVDTELTAGRQRVNAIGWLCYNRPCRGMKLFSFDGQYPVPRNGPGYQGHEGQFLSMLALSRVKSTYPMRVDGQELTVQDLIEYEKTTCRPKTELTFKLVSLAHYLPSDTKWTSKWGVEWSIPRLIQEELAQPINGACCGGTHRLIGYSMAVRARRKRGEPVDGQWLRAEKYVDSYHKFVVKLQNRDGSFSTNWLKGRDGSGDIDRRIQTTGHILEWLVFSLPEEELTDPRIVRAVNYLSSAMLKYRQKEWEIGPRGHALRALALYNERVFGDKPGERSALLARRPKK